MSPPTEHEMRFVAYLEGLVAKENRAALAALRRGLGKEPGEVSDLFPYVIPWLPRTTSPWQEAPFYLLAALFASHQISRRPSEGDESNLGHSLGRLASAGGREGIEQRFIALLNCHRDDLPDHLRRAVALLKSKEIPVTWAQLLHDIRNWEREDRAIQRQWGRAFWSQVSAEVV